METIILFDGICNFCNSLVKFIIRNDKKFVFRFAALQSDAGERLLKEYQLNWKEKDSFVLIDNGKVYQQSDAALRLLNKLPWYWKWTQVFWIFPRSFRDAVYNLISKNRYKWFGKRESCMIPTDRDRNRFL